MAHKVSLCTILVQIVSVPRICTKLGSFSKTAKKSLFYQLFLFQGKDGITAEAGEISFVYLKNHRDTEGAL
ncbi:hypothetical protein MKC73_13670 [[Clostridium] innocuum]|nr:hypothetical protein [[Clostridium] innocuum]